MLLASLSANADVKRLEKDQTAPFSGYLFDDTSELKARTAVQELDVSNKRVILYQKLNDSQSQAIDLLNQRVDLYIKQSNDSAKQVVESRDKTFWSSFAYFALGAGTAVLLTYGVSKASK